MSDGMKEAATELRSVTGVELAQGLGHQPAKGFWAEAWSGVLKRPAAVFGLVWVGIVAFFAVFSPVIASGHPVLSWEATGAESWGPATSPMAEMITMGDVAIIVWAFIALGVVFLGRAMAMGARLRLAIAIGVQAALTVLLGQFIESKVSAREAADWMRELEQNSWFVPAAAFFAASVCAVPFATISMLAYRSLPRVGAVIIIASVFGSVVGMKWSPTLEVYDYREAQASGEARSLYTVVPFSETQGETVMFNRAPGARPVDAWWGLFERELRRELGRSEDFRDEELAGMPADAAAIGRLREVSGSFRRLLSVPVGDVVDEAESLVSSGDIATLLQLRTHLYDVPAPTHLLGTDTLGQDVLSQMLHACRLSISIGIVSTGIAVLIGVTVGAMMGYFGGWVDLLLYRIVEVFMAIPVLFILIVAAGVLPRNTYVMMAIIGCFTWTGAARFVRAEFMKLRNADYVQSARAVGLPLWSILFKHMLPNGVTPVLVEASFAVAAAILIEAILSFLGLGPAGQASWGKLLSNATGDTGSYIWWLAIFPGGAIFLTTLSYNLIGEALRDAIDPKLKKARV